MKVYLIIFFASLSLIVNGQNIDASTELDNMIVKGMNDWKIPGLAAIVVKDGKVVFSKAYGVKNIETKVIVDKETMFPMASTTKAFICIAIGMLVDDGIIDWTDKVRSHMPSFKLSDPYITDDARVQDLLLHNLGVGGIAWAVPFVGSNPTTEYLINRYANAKITYPLRSGFDYQNMMFVHAGKLIEKVTGLHWTTFVEQRILKPIGMNYTVTRSTEFSKLENKASPHVIDHMYGMKVVPGDRTDFIGAAGGIHSCITDIEKYLLFLTNNGIVDQDTLLTPETFSYLFEPKEILTANELGYAAAELNKINWRSLGLGWFQHDYHGKKLDYHTGSLNGAIAIAALMHSEKLGIYVFGNLDHAELRHAIMYKAIDLFAFDDNGRDWNSEVFDLFQGFKKKTKEARSKVEKGRVANTTPSLAIERYVGTYSNGLLGVIEITNEQQLFLTLNDKSPRPLEHWHYDTFKSDHVVGKTDFLPNFLIDSKGEVNGLNLYGQIWKKGK